MHTCASAVPLWEMGGEDELRGCRASELVVTVFMPAPAEPGESLPHTGEGFGLCHCQKFCVSDSAHAWMETGPF